MKKIFCTISLVGALCFSGSVLAVEKIPTAKISAGQDKAAYIPTTANVTVITAKQIKKMGVSNLTQVLRHYAGLQVRDLYGDGSRVQLGMGGFGANSLSNVKVLINGIPFSNPDMGSMDLNRVTVQNIKRVELLTGSSSILYGDGAVGGVINVITKRPKQLAGHIGASAGNYQARDVSASVGDTWKQWQYYFSGLRKHSNGFRDHNRTDSGNYTGQVIYHQKDGTVELHIQHVEDKVRYPGSLTAQQFHDDPSQAGNSTGDFNRIEQLMDLVFHHRYGKHWAMDNPIATRHMKGHGEYSTGFTEQRYVHDMNPQLTGVYNTKAGPFVTTTGMYFEKDLFELSSSNSHDKRSVQAYYTQALIPITKTWKFVVGLRFAQVRSHLESPTRYDDVNDHAFISSEALSWQASKQFRWYLRRAGNYRFPKLDESDTIAAGAKPLVAQKGAMYETGADLQQHKFDTRFDLYQLDLRHEIAYNPTIVSGTDFGSNANLDRTRRRGLLLSESYQVLSTWELGGQYAYVDGKFTEGTDSGNRIPLVSRNKFTAFSLLDFAKHWSWYVASIFVGNRYAGGDNANTQGVLGGTTVYNSNISYHFKHWSMALRLNNLTNKQYAESVFVNGANVKGFYPAPSRNMLLSVNYEF